MDKDDMNNLGFADLKDSNSSNNKDNNATTSNDEKK